MSTSGTFSALLTIAGVVAGAAFPAELVQRSAVPSSSAAAASYSTIPSSMQAVSSASFPVPPPASTTIGGTSTPVAPPSPPAPTPTWHIDVLVGDGSIGIGDADVTSFLDLWASVCTENGCNPQPQDPLEFEFEGVGGGITHKMTGTFTMKGEADHSMPIVQDLLNSINGTLQGSKQCEEVSAQDCDLNGKRDPETPGIANHCETKTFTQCTVADYIQATMYDDESNEKAQVVMSATADKFEFDCEPLVGMMGAAAALADLEPPAAGAVAIVTVGCTIASADKV